jgi:hypothetical protein
MARHPARTEDLRSPEVIGPRRKTGSGGIEGRVPPEPRAAPPEWRRELTEKVEDSMRRVVGAVVVVLVVLFWATGPVAAQQTPGKKPNIVVIMGDDVGMWNLRAYHHGMMGGSTPNIDRIF